MELIQRGLRGCERLEEKDSPRVRFDIKLLGESINFYYHQQMTDRTIKNRCYLMETREYPKSADSLPSFNEAKFSKSRSEPNFRTFIENPHVTAASDDIPKRTPKCIMRYYVCNTGCADGDDPVIEEYFDTRKTPDKYWRKFTFHKANPYIETRIREGIINREILRLNLKSLLHELSGCLIADDTTDERLKYLCEAIHLYSQMFGNTGMWEQVFMVVHTFKNIKRHSIYEMKLDEEMDDL